MGLNRMLSVASQPYPLGMGRNTPTESDKAGTSLMVSSRDLLRFVMGVEKSGLGQGGVRNKGQ